jgi:L-2,4-diaminobutyrate decarboxylase
MLRTPMLCTALLFRDHHPLDITFQQEADYIFHERKQPGVDIGHRTFECSKAALGLKFFMVLGALGEKGLCDYVERQWDLTLRAYEYISGQSDFECAVRPESNVLCFRTTGSDQKQLHIRDALINHGRYCLSSTIFQDKRYLRISMMSPTTELKDIEGMVDMIRQLAAEIKE